MTPVDRHLERWVVHHRAGGLDPVFEWLTRIGSGGAVWVALALLLALVWRRPWLLAAVLVADGVADGIAELVKDATGIERPSSRYASPPPLVPAPHSSSFPSGHTATSFACATVLTGFAPRLAPLWLVLALAIGFSRIYVGVHYPLDVAGGAVLGLAVGLATLAAARALRRRAAARSGSSRGPRAG